MTNRKSHLVLRIILSTLSLWGLGGFCACTGDATFSRHPCYLIIDNSTHLDATLASAMNSMSPGIFCTIVDKETSKQFLFSTSAGLSSSIRWDQKDEYRTRDLGMNNALIVGYGSLTGEFYAFDRECPVCFDPNAIPVRSKPLSVNNNGIATCSVCHRQWNMNTGGNYVGSTIEGVSEDGSVSGLTRYRANATGPYGILSVGN